MPVHARSRPPAILATGALSTELRASLWDVVHSYVFAPHDALDRWTGGVTGRPAVRRIWSSPPISGTAEAIPEDIADVLERWFSLVEPADVYEFVESVHDNLEGPNQQRFAATCNAALDRGLSDHRFVNRRLTPISSRADITAIERALVACKDSGVHASEERLLDALACLALKPVPDCRGAIQEAIRAAECVAFALTEERPRPLDETLEDLEAKGYIDRPLKAAYGGLFAYAGGGRRTTTEDARLIVVMCAGFISHLAARVI